MRNLTIRAHAWLQRRRALADDQGFQTAEGLAFGAVCIIALVAVVQPGLNGVLQDIINRITEALPG
jgi:hypothetical protein